MYKVGLEKVEESKIFCFCFIDNKKAYDFVDHNRLWNILKEMGIPDHLTYLLKNLYMGQEVKLETYMKQLTSLKLGKEYDKAVISCPVYLTSMHSTSCEMPDWMNYKLESIAWRNINNLRYADDTTLMTESEEELKSLLLRIERSGKKLA